MLVARIRRAAPLLAPLLGLALLLGSCRREREDIFVRPEGAQITRALGLAALLPGQGFYELWLGTPTDQPGDGEDPWTVPQDYFPVAAFRVDSLSTLRALDGSIQSLYSFPRELDTDRIARGLLSYQPSSDVGGPHELGLVLAVGDFVTDDRTVQATLDWDDPEVIDKDLSELVGSCRLIALTGDPSEQAAGVWFFGRDPGGVSIPSLELGDPLPGGFTYELWIFQSAFPSLIPAQLIFGGRFGEAAGADSDGAGPDAGGPLVAEYPGQDLVERGVALNGGRWGVMITLEPVLDPAPELPSSLRVLRLDIPTTAPTDVDLSLSNGAENNSLPSIDVTVRR